MKRFTACLVLCFLVSGLSFATEPSDPGRVLDAKKVCKANLKTLLGAVEMYNLDHPTPITELKPEVLQTLLKDGDYLKAVPECLEKGVYRISGDLAKDGKIVCSVHGDVQTIEASLEGTPKVEAPITGDPKTACFSNIRTLYGAIEMYNMANNASMTGLNPEAMSLLIKDMYLKEEPLCLGKGTYGSSGDLTKGGKISCSIHGSLPQ